MKSPICDLLGIEFPLVAFTHCRDVVVEVSKAGGMGVLGAAGYGPETLEVELNWIDEHIDGMPYGVDLIAPTSMAVTDGDNCGGRPAPAHAVTEMNEALQLLGLGDWYVSQHKAVISIEGFGKYKGAKVKLKLHKKQHHRLHGIKLFGLYSVDSEEDVWVLVTKSGKQLAFVILWD